MSDRWRTALTIIGWLAAAGALVGLMVGLELHWNFFSWRPKYDVEAMLYGIGILAILVCIWFLAKTTRGRTCQIASLLFCLILLVIGFLALPPEPLGREGEWFARKKPSPQWYRTENFILLSLPTLFWICNVFLRSRLSAARKFS